MRETKLEKTAGAGSAAVMGFVGDLPPLPQVASRVVALVEDPDTSARDVTEVIASDQALTAKILKASNSAYYGRSGKISALSQAVTLLGFQAVKNLVLVHSLPFGSSAAQSPEQSLQQILWEHSLGAALSARLLAAKKGSHDPEVAFVAGLLHDVGQIVFVMHGPDEFAAVLARAKESNRCITHLERQQYGFDHTVVGSAALEKWHLPSILVDAVATHHDPVTREATVSLAAIVAAASALSHSLGMGVNPPDEAAETFADLSDMLAIEEAAKEEVVTRTLSAVQDERALFNL